MKMKKLIIALCVALIGLIALGVAVKLNGDLDAYHLAQPGPHGQFTGGDRGLLLGLFAVLLAGVAVLSAVVLGITSFLKGRRIGLASVTYNSLVYWLFCAPVVLYVFCFASWALWWTVQDYNMYLK